MKVGFVGCWCHLRIYAVQASHLRGPLEKLTGNEIPVTTSNCGCFFTDPNVFKSMSNYERLLTSQDATYLKLPYLRSKKDSRMGQFFRGVYRAFAEPARGFQYAWKTRDKDIVHFHQSADSFGYDSLKWLLRFARNKVVVTIYRLSPLQEERQKVNKIYNRADAVIVSTDYMKQHLVGCGVLPEKLHVIPYGGASKPISQAKRDGAIMFSGSPLIDVKGFDYLARALRILKDEGKPIRLKLHGFYTAGHKEWAIDIVKKEGIEDLIEWISFRTVDDLIDAYQGSMCSVIPYTAYNGCFPVTVAMANGVPVIGSDAMGIPEYLADGGGIIVESKSAEKLADALRKVHDDEALRASLGKQAKAVAEKRFAWDVLARQTFLVYQQTLQSHPKAGTAPLS
jgi:glycosyltransferase involved in cell wall biosynthesis